MEERKISIKTLVAGLGACTFFIAGLGHSGNADASITQAFNAKTALQEQRNSQWKQEAVSGAHLKGGFSSLLLASRQSTSFRRDHTRTKRQYPRTRYQTKRQNDTRFFQRNRRPSFSTPNIRTYSNTERTLNKRSSITGKSSNFRNNHNTYRRSRSR